MQAVREGLVSGPSDKAVEAASRCGDARRAYAALTLAHDSALGLDRSVCLRDVVDFLRARDEEDGIPRAPIAATLIKREFGGLS